MMGCIGSRLGHISGLVGVNHSSSSSDGAGAHYHSTSVANGGDGHHNNVFSVLNVDDMGRHISPGKLEVTETELILYIQSKAPLNWPLRCLRRYGYENDLFSFESGRRCPTGPGIYAFKCTRAQSLFNLLQAKIQNNPSSNIILPPPQLPTSAAGGADGAGGDGGDESPASTPGSISPTFDYVNIAENSQLLRGNANATANADGTTKNGTRAGLETDGDNNHPVYMNVENKSKGRRVRSSRLCNGSTTTELSSVYQNDYLNYHSAAKVLAGAEYQSDPNSSVLYTNVACTSLPAKKDAAAAAPAPIVEINYAELDLKQVPNSKTLTTRSGGANGTSQQPTVSNNSSSRQSFFSDKLPLDNSKFVPTPNSVPTNSSAASSSNMNTSTTTTAASSTSTNSSAVLSYAILQPPNNNTSSTGIVPHHQPTPSELGYATIDFDRTAALSSVTRSKIKLNFSHSSSTDKDDDDDGGASVSHARKARHNSTAL